MTAKPKRRTRERILEAGLELFNAFGEPHVTTQAIADRLGISPGNLYYHFKSKEQIVAELVDAWRAELLDTLAAPAKRAPDVEDLWLLLHLVFENVGRYRFVYRDAVGLIAQSRAVETRFRQALGHAQRVAVEVLRGLARAGDLRASEAEIAVLSDNMILIVSNWLSFEFVRDPRKPLDADALGRGLYHTMAMLAPFLTGQSRLLFERLAAGYLDGSNQA